MKEPDNIRKEPAKDPAKGPSTTKPTKQLPTPRIAFSKQIDLLVGLASAYLESKSPVTLDSVATGPSGAGLVGLAKSTAALATPFLVDAGLLVKDETSGGFSPSQAVLEYMNAKEWGSDNPEHKLAEALRPTWFAAAVLQRVRLGTASENAIQAALASAAGVDPSRKSQISLLIDFLAFSGLVHVGEDGITLGDSGRVASAGNGKGGAQEEKEKKDKKDPPKDESEEGWTHHPFQLRKGVWAKFLLPEDLTHDDVERLKKWLDTLPLA